MAFSLRASVSNVCNMDCVYCPRWSSMEEFSPYGLETQGLANSDYAVLLAKLAQAVPFSTISLTGGEPLSNRGLDKIAAAVRPHTPKLELNTNGVLLTPQRLLQLRPFFDRIKISMDSADPETFAEITQLKMRNGLERVQDAIRRVRDSGLEVAVNCVVMRSTINGLGNVIEWAQKENVRLHLLDFYHTNERKTTWPEEFVPLEDIIPSLTSRYGLPKMEDVFGCTFLTYDFAGAGPPLRLKTSFSGTMRSERCNACINYCQEGLYGLKLSQKGWVTSCPSNSERDGTQLDQSLDIDGLRNRISWLVDDINSAKLDGSSFDTFIQKNNLRLDR